MWEASDCIAELVHPKPPLPWDCPMESQSCHWCARPSARRGPGGCLLGCRGDSQRNAGVHTFAHKALCGNRQSWEQEEGDHGQKPKEEVILPVLPHPGAQLRRVPGFMWTLLSKCLQGTTHVFKRISP